MGTICLPLVTRESSYKIRSGSWRCVCDFFRFVVGLNGAREIEGEEESERVELEINWITCVRRLPACRPICAIRRRRVTIEV